MSITPPVSIGTVTSSVHSGPLTFNTTAAVPAGGRVIVSLSYFKNGGTRTPSGLTVDGNAATLDRRTTNGNDLTDIWSYHSAAGLASGVAITASWGDNSGFGGRLMGAIYATGIPATGYLDAAAGSSTTGASWSSGAAANVTTEALFIGVVGTEAPTSPTTSSPGAGTTEVHDLYLAADQQGMASGYRIETTIASRSVTGTLSNSSSTANTGALAIYGSAGGGTVALDGASAGTSTVTGALTVRAPVAGAVAGQSAATGALTVPIPVAGALSGQSAVTGALTVRAGLAATAASASTTSGALTARAGLAGTVAGASTVTGALTNTPPGGVALTGTLAGSSATTGALTVTAPLAGSLTGASTITGALTVNAAGTNALAGTLAGTSTVTGTLLVTKPLAGALAGQGALTGALTGRAGLAGALAGAGTVTGAVIVSHRLSGTLPGQSTLTGAITVLRPLAGTVLAVSAVTGNLTNQGPVTAVGRLEAGLTVAVGEGTASAVVSESTSGVLALTE